jgi:hypothetical protein
MKIQNLLKVRPLGSSTVKFTPIYTNQNWHSVYFIRVQSYVLCVTTYLGITLSQIRVQVNNFESTLMQSRIEVPTEVAQSLPLGITSFIAILHQARDFGHALS